MDKEHAGIFIVSFILIAVLRGLKKIKGEFLSTLSDMGTLAVLVADLGVLIVSLFWPGTGQSPAQNNAAPIVNSATAAPNGTNVAVGPSSTPILAQTAEQTLESPSTVPVEHSTVSPSVTISGPRARGVSPSPPTPNKSGAGATLALATRTETPSQAPPPQVNENNAPPSNNPLPAPTDTAQPRINTAIPPSKTPLPPKPAPTNTPLPTPTPTAELKFAWDTQYVCDVNQDWVENRVHNLNQVEVQVTGFINAKPDGGVEKTIAAVPDYQKGCGSGYWCGPIGSIRQEYPDGFQGVIWGTTEVRYQSGVVDSKSFGPIQFTCGG